MRVAEHDPVAEERSCASRGTTRWRMKAARCRRLVGARPQAAELYPAVARAYATSTTNLPHSPDAKANEIVMECLDDHVAKHVPDDDVHHHVAEPSPSRAGRGRDAPDFKGSSLGRTRFG